LLEVVLLLRVLPNEFDQFWPDRKSAVVELRDLFIISNIQVAAAGTEQGQQFFHVLDLAEYLRFHMGFSLQIVLGWVL
jgi:hypothetical protein